MDELFASLQNRFKTLATFRCKAADFESSCLLLKEADIKLEMKNLSNLVTRFKKREKEQIAREDKLFEKLFEFAEFDLEQRM